MKRLFSAISSFSEESEVIIKRARLLITSLSPSRAIRQQTSLSSFNRLANIRDVPIVFSQRSFLVKMLRSSVRIRKKIAIVLPLLMTMNLN